MQTIQINSRKKVEMIDITADVQSAVRNFDANDGLIHLYVPHTTAAVTINENADPDVTRDLVMELNKIVPFEDGYYHLEGNSAAHLKSSLVGVSEFIPMQNGQPLLGTWQGIYFCEFDGPRQRKLHIKVIPG